jgi:hypothetical protein
MLVSSSTHHADQRPAPGETCGHRYVSHPGRISCQRLPGHDLEYGHRDSAGPDVQRVWQDDGRSSTRAAPGVSAGSSANKMTVTRSGLALLIMVRHAAGVARPWNADGAHPTVLTVHTDRPDSMDTRPLYVRGHCTMTVYSATR